MNTNRGSSFGIHTSKAIGYHHLCLSETQRQGSEKTLYNGEKMEDSRYALIGGCWHGKAGRRQTRSKLSYVVSLRTIFGFLWLVLS